jgi:hypothetical protein
MSQSSETLLAAPGEEDQPAASAPTTPADAERGASPRPAGPAESDLSTIDPNQVARIVIASEGREVPVDVDPSATPLPELVRLLTTSKDAAQRLAARVLGTTPSHVMGDAAINVKVTRSYRESDRTLVIEAVKQPGQKGYSPRSSQTPRQQRGLRVSAANEAADRDRRDGRIPGQPG